MSTISPSSTTISPAAGFNRSVCIGKRLSSTALAILDACGYNKGLLITRINVPAEFRGTGEGTCLLKQLIQQADSEGIKLFLEPAASGGLSQDDLVAWYQRHGFHWWKRIMRRNPGFPGA